MIPMSPERVLELFDRFKKIKVIVIGDVMLDRYIWGSVSRISPEAPVPVVEVASESNRLGGAANVAFNITTLGAAPVLLGVVGDDFAGSTIRALMKKNKFTVSGVVTDTSRISTVKTRVIAHGQHVVRTDSESKEPIGEQVCGALMQVLKKNIQNAGAIIFEDYNKGLITSELINGVLALAEEHCVPVMVDPKFNHFFEYLGVSAIKPNKLETEQVLGIRLSDKRNIRRAGAALLERLECDNVLLTLGEEGMYLFQRSGEITHVATKAREVHDVSGAGDTVISTYTVASAAGASPREAAALANYAAGLVCGEVGIKPVNAQDLKRIILEEKEE